MMRLTRILVSVLGGLFVAFVLQSLLAALTHSALISSQCGSAGTLAAFMLSFMIFDAIERRWPSR